MSLVTVLAAVFGAILAGALPTHAATNTVVSLTFDDGWSDQYQVNTMLTSRQMHGTFYVNSGRIGQSNYLTWDQLHTLSTSGQEIAGHTVDHADLTTLTTAQATSEICDDRTTLINNGFSPTDFAYPYGAYNSTLEGVVKNCGYNSARTVGGIVSGSSCSSCPYSESIPPADAYATRTPDSIKTDTTLSNIEAYVTGAEQHGGGWVQLVFHHICATNCPDTYSVTPTTLTSFLDWLSARSSTGTVVKTVSDVMAMPPQPAPPPPPPGPNTLQNPGLESDTNGDNVPDCWQLGGYGTNSATWTRTTNAHSGSYAESVQITSYSSGDRKLVSAQDSGTCAPAAVAGHIYGASVWYNSTAPVTFVGYYRTSTGTWAYWVDGPTFPASSTWSQASWTTPAVPSGATNLSFGLALTQVGTLTTDDYAFGDTAAPAADTTPPTVSVTSPVAGAAVSGVVNVAASASDNVGVSQVDFYAGTTHIGTATAAPYQVQWNTTAVPDGPVTLSAVATDTSGNVTPEAASESVTVSNGTPTTTDTQPPTVSLTAPADGAVVGGAVTVSASASDNVGVASVEFFAGSTSLGVATSSPYQVTWDTRSVQDGSYTLTAVAKDAANNTTTSAARTVTVRNALVIPNAGLEQATNGVPDCWTPQGGGSYTASWVTLPVHSGLHAETVQVTKSQKAGIGLVQAATTSCATPVNAGASYTLSGWYQSNARVYIIAWYLNSSGSWTQWQTSAAAPASSTWAQAAYATPAVPAGVAFLRFGLMLKSTGTITTDDYGAVRAA